LIIAYQYCFLIFFQVSLSLLRFSLIPHDFANSYIEDFNYLYLLQLIYFVV
ncbi:hypothetical protein L9F63_012545, partial [Diploptera punctata]